MRSGQSKEVSKSESIGKMDPIRKLKQAEGDPKGSDSDIGRNDQDDTLPYEND